MSDKHKRAAGGVKLLTEQVVAELRDSEALAELVGALRQQEASLARSLQEAGLACERLACQSCITELLGNESELLGGKGPDATCATMDASEFAQAVLALRGVPKMALRRREAREAARTFAYLSTKAPLVPQCVRDFQTLWEIAQEGEPRLNKDFPSSEIRVKTSFIADPETPGGCLQYNTSPENILPELEELVAFIRSEGLMSEVQAAAAYASCMFTHPFDDGNGHLGRMLMLFMMAPNYSLLINVCFSRTLAMGKRDLGNAVRQVYEGTSTLTDFCQYALGLLDGTHSAARNLLESVR